MYIEEIVVQYKIVFHSKRLNRIPLILFYYNFADIGIKKTELILRNAYHLGEEHGIIAILLGNKPIIHNELGCSTAQHNINLNSHFTVDAA